MGGRACRVKRVGAAAFLLLLNIGLLIRYHRLARRFFRRMGYVPDFAAPVTFTEKVHWRKIFDDDPRFAVLLDKLRAKQFVGHRLPWLGFPQVLWQGENPLEIPFGRFTALYREVQSWLRHEHCRTRTGVRRQGGHSR